MPLVSDPPFDHIETPPANDRLGGSSGALSALGRWRLCYRNHHPQKTTKVLGDNA